ncbi:hypothetical protein RCL_jg15106.t1 [Rhizophagus clarus]|uniref:Uncharacterized protein n=1 Tax=Rhizophagus clarus TaxID=94130 RepID=A0A8H3L1D4_9GLOM|nr:hypothetical protein RCL_jg15106.t1 [Rhizophagus clarus]
MNITYLQDVKVVLKLKLKVQVVGFLQNILQVQPQLCEGITVITSIAASLYEQFSDYQLDLDKGKSKSSDTGEDLLKMETDADTSYQLTATFVVQPVSVPSNSTKPEKKKFISLNSSLDSALAGQHQSSSGIPISDTNRLPASNVSSDDKDLVGNNKKLKANQGITGF